MSELELTPVPNPEFKAGDVITVIDPAGERREMLVMTVDPDSGPFNARTAYVLEVPVN